MQVLCKAPIHPPAHHSLKNYRMQILNTDTDTPVAIIIDDKGKSLGDTLKKRDAQKPRVIYAANKVGGHLHNTRPIFKMRGRVLLSFIIMRRDLRARAACLPLFVLARVYV